MGSCNSHSPLGLRLFGLKQIKRVHLEKVDTPFRGENTSELERVSVDCTWGSALGERHETMLATAGLHHASTAHGSDQQPELGIELLLGLAKLKRCSVTFILRAFLGVFLERHSQHLSCARKSHLLLANKLPIFPSLMRNCQETYAMFCLQCESH